jgi:hypothetical protein
LCLRQCLWYGYEVIVRRDYYVIESRREFVTACQGNSRVAWKVAFARLSARETKIIINEITTAIVLVTDRSILLVAARIIAIAVTAAIVGLHGLAEMVMDTWNALLYGLII